MNPWGRNRNSFPSKALFHHLFVYHMAPLSSCGATCSLQNTVPEPLAHRYQSSTLPHSTHPCERALCGNTGTGVLLSWRARLNEGGWKSKTFRRTEVDKPDKWHNWHGKQVKVRQRWWDFICYILSNNTVWCWWWLNTQHIIKMSCVSNYSDSICALQTYLHTSGRYTVQPTYIQ